MHIRQSWRPVDNFVLYYAKVDLRSKVVSCIVRRVSRLRTRPIDNSSSSLRKKNYSKEKVWRKRKDKKERNSQGKYPRTFEEHSHGRDRKKPRKKQPGKGFENLSTATKEEIGLERVETLRKELHLEKRLRKL